MFHFNVFNVECFHVSKRAKNHACRNSLHIIYFYRMGVFELENFIKKNLKTCIKDVSIEVEIEEFMK